MKVMLKLVLDCDPDAAWRALRSPTVMREVAAPWLDFSSREAEGLPPVWTLGEHPVDARLLGTIPMGEQVIDLSLPGGLPAGVRMLRDGGGGRSGVMAALTSWNHRMAVSPDPAGTGLTLYRDRLEFTAGAAGAAAWYPTWLFWQWRGRRLRSLAHSWAHDIGVDAERLTRDPGAASPGV